mmetsp:Transcript_26608/g.67795  ORF Transcript_26608/g.67795 Transcript_26608/m.67795 type:complete len:209 (+) Transcript_26608:2498-3124(+)
MRGLASRDRGEGGRLSLRLLFCWLLPWYAGSGGGTRSGGLKGAARVGVAAGLAGGWSSSSLSASMVSAVTIWDLFMDSTTRLCAWGVPGTCCVSLYTRSKPCSHLSASPGVSAFTTSRRSGKCISIFVSPALRKDLSSCMPNTSTSAFLSLMSLQYARVSAVSSKYRFWYLAPKTPIFPSCRFFRSQPDKRTGPGSIVALLWKGLCYS